MYRALTSPAYQLHQFLTCTGVSR